MSGILVFLEQRDGMVRQASIDLWNRLQEQAAAGAEPQPLSGIIAGPASTVGIETMLSGSGTIYHVSSDLLCLYQPESYTQTLAELFERSGCSSLVFADTALSRDLAPRLSVRLGASLLSGCSGPSAIGAGTCMRPVYAASVVASFAAEAERRIYTISSQGPAALPRKEGAIVIVPVDDLSCEPSRPSAFASRIAMTSTKPDVSEANIIVAGGRGLGSADAFAMLDELAGLLGGAVGASRAVVDEGWRPHSEQIGQTGKTVAPRLYLACGISGTVQHLAGTGGAVMLVAINSDRHAPIFDVADFGIVGDVHTIIPGLIKEVREFLKKK
ncbi:MAG: electron transfer flavoprotein subunit alpha/FixB family protein [Chlorobiaceae bacterium]|nr:electron transfer flavoprotein subunit alpha/FixB family protein [Chlorobiaceae bacterium]